MPIQHPQCCILPLSGSPGLSAFRCAWNWIPLHNPHQSHCNQFLLIMKRTLIALIALAGMANAAWYNVTGTTGDDLFTDNGTQYTMFVDGNGNKVAISDELKSVLTTSGGTLHNLNFGTADGASTTPSVSISEALYVAQIHTTRADSLTINFKEAGSITASSAFNIGSIPVNISASLSTSEKNALSNGETVTRTLVTTDYFETVPNVKDSITLNIQADGLSYGGLLYSVYSNGSHTYYSFDDVTFNTTGNFPNRYASVKSGATAYELEAGKYYSVLSGTQSGGAAVKYLSFVATSPIPEPTTATLSLLALAGLAARRRRK